MTGNKFCVNHPVKAATHACKHCGNDICNQCVVQTDLGIFCSKACYDAVREFQGKVAGLGVRHGPSFFDRIKAWLKQLIVAAIAIGVVYGVFYYVFGASSPGAIWDKIKGLLGL